MYQVIGTLRSRAFRVLWALEELGQPYELVPAAPRSELARGYNPSGKVPALVVEGTVLTDSVAIVQFLADRHGALTHPAGTLARGLQDAMTQFLVDEMEGPLWTAARHSFILSPEERVPQIKLTARADFARAMTDLELRLGTKPFAAGGEATVPDILYGHCALWAAEARFAIPDGPLTAWAARLHARPAFQRVLAMRGG